MHKISSHKGTKDSPLTEWSSYVHIRIEAILMCTGWEMMLPDGIGRIELTYATLWFCYTPVIFLCPWWKKWFEISVRINWNLVCCFSVDDGKFFNVRNNSATCDQQFIQQFNFIFPFPSILKINSINEPTFSSKEELNKFVYDAAQITQEISEY